jgi:hypothetical protein
MKIHFDEKKKQNKPGSQSWLHIFLTITPLHEQFTAQTKIGTNISQKRKCCFSRIHAWIVKVQSAGPGVGYIFSREILVATACCIREGPSLNT